MNQKMTQCKSCNQEIAKNAKVCPNCGVKNKKTIFTKWWFWVILGVVLFAAIGNSGSQDDIDSDSGTNIETEANVDTEGNIDVETKDNSTEASPNTDKEPIKTEYFVGDAFEDKNIRIVFMASGDYEEDNQFSQPAEGKKYIYLQFAIENISKGNDVSISCYDFECFADGYATNMYYAGGEALSATLSAGRATTGYIYFEVPTDAKVIEIEYETNFFTEKKIKFLFEGNKKSDYEQSLDTTPTEGAHAVGAVVESSRLKITYLSCEEYISDNMFIGPAEGYHFISCKFEFENVGKSDESISSFSFDCYADGLDCKAIFIRDDDLSATLSAGRKVTGTVTFEVPLDAKVVEVEYLSNYWTSNRVIFSAN